MNKRFCLCFFLAMLLGGRSHAQCSPTAHVGPGISTIGATAGWGPCINNSFLLPDALLDRSATLTANIPTPTVSGYRNWKTANTLPTTIKNFTGGYQGQEIAILCGDTNTSINSDSTIALAASFSCASSTGIDLILNRTVWTEVGRAENSTSAGDLIPGATQINAGVPMQGLRPDYDATAYGASASGQTTRGDCNGTTTVKLEKAIDFQNGQGIALYGCGARPSISTPTGLKAQQNTSIPVIAMATDATAGATCTGTTATISTRGWHGLTTGESVTVANVKNSSGSSLSQYDITATITVTSNYQFTYAIASCPGSGGSLDYTSNLATVTLNAGSHTYSYKVAGIDANNGVTAVSTAASISTANTATGPQVYNSLTWNSVTGATMYAIYRKFDSGSYACVGTGEQSLSSYNPTYDDYGASLHCAQNVPSSPPSSVVPQILITSIVNGGGTTTLTLKNAASTNVSSATVQHDDTAPANTAILAGCSNTLSYQGNGGLVKLPGPGTYYLQTLVFPRGCFGMKIEVGGTLYPRQPINSQGRSGWEISGTIGGGVGAGAYGPSSSNIISTGQAPLIDIVGSDPFKVSNLLGYLCVNDCVRLTGGDTFITLSNLSMVEATNGAGYPLHCTDPNGSEFYPYSTLIDGGSFTQDAGIGQPAIFIETCGNTTGKNFSLNRGNITIKPNVAGVVFGSDNWSNITTEALNTPTFTFDTSLSSTTISDEIISDIDNADNLPGGDCTFISAKGRGVTNIFSQDANEGGCGFTNRILSGAIINFNLGCIGQNSNCSGAAAAFLGNTAPGSGWFTDNKAQTYYFANRFYPGIHIAAQIGQIPFQVEQPLGTVVASISPVGRGTFNSLGTDSNCSSSASPAVCGSAAAGSVVIAASASNVVVDTSAVTAKSQIVLTFDSSLGMKLGVTCNTAAQQPFVSARSAGTSFTISVPSNFSTNPGCFSYSIIN